MRQLVERAQLAILAHLGDRSRDRAVSLGSAVAYFVDGARDHGGLPLIFLGPLQLARNPRPPDAMAFCLG